MSMPRSILHVIDSLDGYSGSKQLKILIDHQLQSDSQLSVVALKADPNVLKAWGAEGIDCQVLDRRWILDPISLGRLAKIFWCNNFDLIHAWNQDAIDYVRLANNKQMTPWIGTLLHHSHGCLPARILWKKPHALVTSVPFDESDHIIFPGIRSLPLDLELRSDFLMEQSLDQDSPLIAVSGKLTRDKKIEEAIWTFELLRTINDKVSLLIFGDGPERGRLERFARLASESSSIRFLGYRDNFQQCLAFIDVFWYSGMSNGNIKMSLLEAMLSEVPVVVTECREFSTLIEHNSNGMLVPLDHRAMRARHTLQLLENPELASQIGRQGAKSVQSQFSTSKMVEAYDNLYMEISGDNSLNESAHLIA